jgi:beta-glucosidase
MSITVYLHQKAGIGYRSPLPPGVARHYLDLEATPFWPFGHGMNHTPFALDNLDRGPDTGTDGTARISATVANTGGRDGAGVVQLYFRVNTVVVSRPARQLGGFARAELTLGESGVDVTNG